MRSARTAWCTAGTRPRPWTTPSAAGRALRTLSSPPLRGSCRMRRLRARAVPRPARKGRVPAAGARLRSPLRSGKPGGGSGRDRDRGLRLQPGPRSAGALHPDLRRGGQRADADPVLGDPEHQVHGPGYGRRQLVAGLARAQGEGEGREGGPARNGAGVTDVLALTALELEARGLARQLELPRISRFAFPVYELERSPASRVSGRLRLAPVGPRAALLRDRWPALTADLVSPLVISAGTCGALAPELGVGDLLLPESVLGLDGERLNVTPGAHAAALRLAPGARQGLLLTSRDVVGTPQEREEPGRGGRATLPDPAPNDPPRPPSQARHRAGASGRRPRPHRARRRVTREAVRPWMRSSPEAPASSGPTSFASS